jgi:hypothetical protein
MNAPFTREDFLDVFARYNEATWPMPFFLLVLALLALLALNRHWRHCDRLVSTILMVLWSWSGIVFHLGFFADVSPVGFAFGILFLFQAGGFFRWGVMRHRVVFNAPGLSRRGITGAILIGYALFGYPLIAAAHGWPRIPTFGAPCPVVLFTFGLLFWSGSTLPRPLLIAPLAWAVIGSSAAVQFGMYEDWALAPAAVAAAIWLLPRRSELRALSHELRATGAIPHRIRRHGNET